MISGLPRPATTGSASPAPAVASLRMSGSGLISVFSGEKPDTMMPGAIEMGNGRAAIAPAAACRSADGNASRRANTVLRRSALSSSNGMVVVINRGPESIPRRKEGSAEPRWPSERDPGNLHK